MFSAQYLESTALDKHEVSSSGNSATMSDHQNSTRQLWYYIASIRFWVLLNELIDCRWVEKSIDFGRTFVWDGNSSVWRKLRVNSKPNQLKWKFQNNDLDSYSNGNRVSRFSFPVQSFRKAENFGPRGRTSLGSGSDSKARALSRAQSIQDQLPELPKLQLSQCQQTSPAFSNLSVTESIVALTLRRNDFGKKL